MQVDPKKLQKNLSMTVREYRKTPEYKLKVEEELKKLNIEIKSSIAPFVEMAQKLQKEFNESGIIKLTTETQKQYEHLIKTIQNPEIKIRITSKKQATNLNEKIIKSLTRQAAEILKKEFNPKRSTTEIFVLTPEGDLYKKNNPKQCYFLHKSGHRLEILDLLVKHQQKNESFLATQIIVERTNYKNIKSVSKAINEINCIARRIFKFKTEKELKLNLIDSKPHSGYRINPKYYIEG
ncbi:MAG: hypothetical protein V1664_00250 [Candidatus Uhrbacteria bacterium]